MRPGPGPAPAREPEPGHRGSVPAPTRPSRRLGRETGLGELLPLLPSEEREDGNGPGMGGGTEKPGQGAGGRCKGAAGDGEEVEGPGVWTPGPSG